MNEPGVYFIYRLTSKRQAQLSSFFQRSSIIDYGYLLPIATVDGFSAVSFNRLYCY